MEKLNERIKNIPIPRRMRELPIDERGFPVPKFVPWINGKPDFRGMNGKHLAECVKKKLCWMCGDPLGVHMTFVIGPMCAVNRVSSEPPSHHSCGDYAGKACPFLTQPRMRRNPKDMPEGEVAGIMIARNPGVVMLWTTRSYKMMRTQTGPLFIIGDPEKIQCYAEGRQATPEELAASIASGIPLLEKMAKDEGPEAEKELKKQYEKAMKVIPEFWRSNEHTDHR